MAVSATAKDRQPLGRWARKVALLLVPITLLGELGHQVFERVGEALAHHLFHILFLGGAVMVFAVFAIVDIRRHGWPEFTWRLRPGQPR